MSIRSGAQAISQTVFAAGRWIRRWPVCSALVGIVLFLLLVPAWPYKPHCGNWGSCADFRTLEGEMTPEFLEAMEIALADEDVRRWRIGDSIYIRFLMWLFPEGAFDEPGSGNVLNAQLQAVHRLVTPNYSGTHIGQKLGGRLYQPPEYLKVFLDEGWPDAENCVFIRAVAFGEPPPPRIQARAVVP